jgi:predicted permease
MVKTFRRLAAWVRRNSLDDQLAEEIRDHLAERARRIADDEGLTPEAAAREARRRFGNVLAIREDSRAMWGFPALDTFLQDVRFGLRLMRRSPTFTVVAVLSLAIGMGGAVAVFSLADAILFRKLPVRDPDGLHVVRWISGPTLPFDSLNGHGSQGDTESSSTSFSLAAFEALRDQQRELADVIGFAELYQVNLGIDGQAELGKGLAVSGNYFDVLGVAPRAGRLLTAQDDARTAPAVAMISYALWQRRFGGSADALRRPMTINGIPVAIVGVAPPGFGGTMQVGDPAAVFVPLSLAARLERSDDHFNPNHWWVLMMARLRSGVPAGAAASSFDAVVKQSVRANRASIEPKDVPRVVLDPGARGQMEARGWLREPLETMAGVVAIVLLVACANVANLLLARATSRNREIAMRVAIGAPRSRIVRQLMTESLLLSTAGAIAGVAVAKWLAAGLLPALERGNGLDVAMPLDWRAVAFTATLGVAVSMLFGVLPALRTARGDVRAGIQEGTRGQVGATRRFGVAGGLVAFQIALSMILVAGAGLLVGSVRNLERVDPGFDPSNILLFRIDPTLNGYEGERLRSLHLSILERVRALPGVVSASMSEYTLIAGSSAISEVYTGRPAPLGASGRPRRPLAWRMDIDDEFFKTMGMQFTTGRIFGPGESPASQPVAIVNPTFVRAAFADESALGRRFKLSGRPGAPEYEIVGVVEDAKYTTIRDDAPPTVYLSARQTRPGRMTFALKTSSDPLLLVESVRSVVSAIEPNVPLSGVRTQEAQIADSLRRERLFAQLATMLGAVTLGLCAIGLYGLLIASVSRRIPEIGVRMALGAERWDVRWMVLRQSLMLVVAGLALGLPGAVMSMRMLESLRFGLEERDPWVLSSAVVVLIVVSAIAAYVPALRASRVDPVIALRS